LIGHQGHHARHAASRDHVAHQHAGGDHPRSEATAQGQHRAVGPTVDQRLVGRIERYAELTRKAEQDPFPIALVRRNDEHRSTRTNRPTQCVQIDEAHARIEILTGDGGRLDDLHENIGEASIVRGAQTLESRGVELRKGNAQAVADPLRLVRKHVHREPCQQRRQRVQHRYRQRSEGADPP
jgi:hypothetical protein